jgi:DNA-binding NarL/FixJ family response regulator
MARDCPLPASQSRTIPFAPALASSRPVDEIAEHLVLSLKTVRNQVANICGKLQVADRAQAVIRAREAGLG